MDNPPPDDDQNLDGFQSEAREKKRKREARKQATEDDVFDYPHSGLYNIWYDRVQDYSTWKDRREAKYVLKNKFTGFCSYF